MDYPKGAISSVADFLQMKGQPIYCVLGLGRVSEIGEVIPTGETETAVNSLFFLVEGNARVHSFDDLNIPLNGYNEHFAFADKTDADAYFTWAESNTSAPVVNARYDYRGED